jgi:hypothetical protein
MDLEVLRRLLSHGYSPQSPQFCQIAALLGIQKMVYVEEL